MIDRPIEAKKDGLAQLQDGCWTLKLKVHLDDMPTWLMSAPMGTRLACAIVEIGDDEQPVSHEISPAKKAYAAKTEGEKAVTRAGILCGEMAFQQWIRECFPRWTTQVEKEIGQIDAPTPEDIVRGVLCVICNIPSRADLSHDRGALHYFVQMEQRYREATGQAAEPR